MRTLLLAPLWTLLWYLDELLFPAYRRHTPRALLIIGQARSGSTFLHRTLADDEDTFFAIRHIEWLYPFITVQKLIACFGLDRYLRKRALWPDTESGRKAAQMHSSTLYDYEADGFFWSQRFLFHFFVLSRFPYPGLTGYMEDFSALPAATQRRLMKTYQAIVRKIAYLRGGQRTYLAKEHVSKRMIPPLQRFFPNASIVVTARPSMEYVSSVMRLERLSALTKTTVDATRVPGWEEVVTGFYRRDAMLLLELWRDSPPERSIALGYHALLAHVTPSIACLYQRLGCEPGPRYLERLREIQAQQTTRERGYDYQQKSVAGFESFDAFVAETEAKHQVILQQTHSALTTPV